MPHDFRRISPLAIGAAAALLASSAVAGAAVPRTGHMSDANGKRVVLDVSKHGAARDVSTRLRYTAACEDGSSISGRVGLPRTRVSDTGRFAMTAQEGGNFSAHGKIRLTATVRGRFEKPDRASGSFRIRAIVTRDEFAPSIACHTGLVGWTASR
jgi:opacity protein-like surface antigen